MVAIVQITHCENKASCNYKYIFQFLFFNKAVGDAIFHIYQRAYLQIL